MVKAGFYEIDITPSIGMERPATYRKIFIEKINDPLKVRAAVISDGEITMAFAGVDICFPGDNIIDRVREALPTMNVMISASHTHYGGPMGMCQAPSDASELVHKLINEESVCANPHYTTQLVNQIVTAIKMAHQRMEEVKLSFGKGNVDGVTFNRGFKMKNGHRSTHPGKCNPDIVAPFAPIDSEVGVIGFWRKTDDSFLGCMVNFSCHATCDGTGATADWPGQMVRTIKAVLDKDSGVVYLYGCAGDITQIDNLSLCPSEVGPEYSKIVGVMVGAEALKVLMKAKKGDVSLLKVTSDELVLQRRKPSEQSLQKALTTVNQWKRDTDFHFAKERLIVDSLIRHEPEMQYRIQLFQIGPLVIAAIPGEAFCGVGLAVKIASKFPFTWVSSLANDAGFGYICTKDVFDPVIGGGYESRITSFTCTEPEAADKIINKLNEMINLWIPDAIPTGPQIEPVVKVWGYGNNLPELE